MNREAVALGVRVYTTFEGRPGAVDEALIAEGRMHRLERAEDLEVPVLREAPAHPRVRRDPRSLVELLLSARAR
jgi:predicted glycosyltransferase